MRLHFVFQKNELFCLKIVHRFSFLTSSCLPQDKICLREFVHLVCLLLAVKERALDMATLTKRIDKHWQAKVRKKGFPTVSKTFPTKAAAQNRRVRFVVWTNFT